LVLKQVWTSSGCGLEGFVTEAEKWRYGKVGFRAGFVTERVEKRGFVTAKGI